MNIIAIKREKKKLTRLCFQNGETAVVDSDLCAEKCIHEGDTLTEEKLKELLEESDFRRAKSRALWLLDRYSYTERRLTEKLRQAGFGAKAAAGAVARLKELGLINDSVSAPNFAEDLARRGISRRAAYSKLLQKGFDADTVRQALSATEFDEGDQLKNLIERKYAAKIAAGETEKVYAALVRRGFSYSAVRAALSAAAGEFDYGGDE